MSRNLTWISALEENAVAMVLLFMGLIRPPIWARRACSAFGASFGTGECDIFTLGCLRIEGVRVLLAC